MREYETIVSAVMVLPKREPIYSEMTTTIALEDEAAGLYVQVSQERGERDTKESILIDAEEWPAIRAAITRMVRVCHKRNRRPHDGRGDGEAAV